MRRSSRILVATVVVLLVAVTATAGAQTDNGTAQRSADADNFKKSEFTVDDGNTTRTSTGKVDATLKLKYEPVGRQRFWRMHNVTVHWSGPGKDGCVIPPTTKEFDRPERSTTLAVTPTFVCNGTYTANVKAVVGPVRVFPGTTTPPPADGPVDGDSKPNSVDTGITLTVSIDAPAPNLAARPDAAIEDNQVVLAWKFADKPPDVSFVVERKSADGDWKMLGSTEQMLWADRPDSGGKFSYRVRTKRPRGPQSTGEALSSASDAPIATIDVPAPDKQGVGGSPDPTKHGKTPNTGSSATLPSVPAPKPPPHAVPATPGGGPMPTIGDGFDPVIDYGNDNPTLGSDEDYEAFGGATVLNDDDGFTPRGLMKPTAGALVLAGWALHLRRLSRLAALPA